MKTDKEGYYSSAAGLDDNNDLPSEASLTADTPNQGYEQAKSEGFKGKFQDFLDFYNKNKENPIVQKLKDAIDSLKKNLPGAGLTNQPPVSPGNGNPNQPTTYLGMPAPVAIIVVVTAVGLIGFGIYKLTAKKS